MAHEPASPPRFSRDGAASALPEVRDVEFPLALRGYEREAVDAYVARVSELVAQLEATQSPASAVNRALDRVAEETKGILARAHETQDEIEARSRAQADERLQRAEQEAAAAIAAGEARVRELDADAERIWQERQRLVDEVRVLATELLAVADGANERYPIEHADGPPPGALVDTSELEPFDRQEPPPGAGADGRPAGDEPADPPA